MANKKQKLELTWIGKDEELHLEPRILIEDPSKSYGDPKSENMLIHGDNLLALKALEQDFAGRIKCIYIDPPYNTGSAFEHYDDNLEHSTWLSLMRPRLELLRSLLHPTEGSIWISIDDDESHYLKVLCDEVFGRSNFVANVIWEKKSSPQNDAKWLSDSHDHVLVFAKNKSIWRPNKLSRTDKQNAIYNHSDADDGVNSDGKHYGRGPWFPGDMTVKTISENCLYEITTPSGRKVKPADGRAWVYNEERFKELVADNRITFGEAGNNKPCIKRFITEIQSNGVVPKTIWHYSEVGENRNARQEVKTFSVDDPFSTPKPEKLIARILEIATVSGDWVLDSFLASGTTAAVAHKMGRKYIGIEMGDHADTHCQSRLKKVIDGTDRLKLSEELKWKGGGGFKFYNLAPSLLRKDTFGNFVIDPSYNANMLAAAVCKHEGFKFYPDEMFYWKQGNSTENDFIYVTTNFITAEQLDKLNSEMKPDESLLICAKSYAPECEDRFANITIKKIPQMILGTCEFGKDNYDLNIVQSTDAQAQESNAA